MASPPRTSGAGNSSPHTTGSSIIPTRASHPRERLERGPAADPLEALGHSNRNVPLTRDLVDALYGDPLVLSPSTLETFASCAFSFFAGYGLGLEERVPFRLDAALLGLVSHAVLSRFVEVLTHEGIDWGDLEREQTDAMVERIVAESLEKVVGDQLKLRRSEHFALERLKKGLQAVVWALGEHVRKGSFRPSNVELSFAPQGALPPLEVETADGRRTIVRGRIDRIDEAEAEGVRYVRVIDYKSSARPFRLHRLIHGLDLQLAVYLAVLAQGKTGGGGFRVAPAGCLYQPVFDPLVSMEAPPEAGEGAWRKKLRADGLVLDDGVAPRLMDGEALGSWSLSRFTSARTAPWAAIRLRSIPSRCRHSSNTLSGGSQSSRRRSHEGRPASRRMSSPIRRPAATVPSRPSASLSRRWGRRIAGSRPLAMRRPGRSFAREVRGVVKKAQVESAQSSGGGSRWTPSQERAIVERDRDILVSAAAGSGKTSVLVERIVRRLLDPENPIDIDRMLVVTFTESAAGEMRERIRLALERAADEGGRRAARQLSLLGKASISTLHGFCLQLARRHFYLLDVDPRFRVLDAEEASLYKLEAMEELFETVHQDDDGTFLPLIDHYGGRRDDQELRRILLDLYEYVQSLPDGEAWLDRVVRSYDLNQPESAAAITIWQESLMFRARVEIEHGLACLEHAMRIARLGAGPAGYLSSFETAFASLERVLEPVVGGRWDDASLAFAPGRLSAAVDRGRGRPRPQRKRLRNPGMRRKRSSANSVTGSLGAAWHRIERICLAFSPW